MKTVSRYKALLVLAAAALSWLPGAATASTYLFTLTGPNTASFTLNSSPVPDATVGQLNFTLLDVAATYNGAPTLFDLTFYSTAESGGFYAQGTPLSLAGAQLFTGFQILGPGQPPTSPTFKLGTFALCDCSFGTPNYSLTISDTSPVPEPASWSMMLLGFGAIGFAIRRRRARALA